MSSSPQISPKDEELPSEFADRLGLAYASSVTQEHKKAAGQFFTPLAIADFMAGLANTNQQEIFILDPGCGTAILSCRLIERLASAESAAAKVVYLTVYETDYSLIPFTEASLKYLRHWAKQAGIDVQTTLHLSDFVLDNAEALRPKKDIFSSKQTVSFDFVIANPPYFKLSKDDPRSLAGGAIVNGQANIYALFMAISTALLKEGGALIFITPRSFTSGNYFRAFRKYFFDRIGLQQVHLFVSRRDTFSRDNVLQETMILKGIKSEKHPANSEVIISSSRGLSDLSEPVCREYKQKEILDLKTDERILHLPITDAEEDIVQLFKSWPNKLKDHNIQISTGPVVSFRAWDYIKEVYENGTVFLVPLLWLQNVAKMKIEWPLTKAGKGQYILSSPETRSLLVPNRNYVLLRRFSAKDDKSRLVAAPYFEETHGTKLIGIENKLNYIYRPKGNLERNEITGLAAILNSTVFDRYFRTFNGNVNVSATELREMPMPPLEAIKEIGALLSQSYNFTQDSLDAIICDYFKLNTSILHEQD